MTPPEESDHSAPLITPRAVILGVLTIAAMFYYIIQIAQRQGSGTYVHAQYPMAAFMPFALWLVTNLVLKALWPRIALTRGELLTLFSMTWVVATIPVWINAWTSALAAPTHFAAPENRWADFFDYMPWHALPPTTASVIDYFWYGQPQGMSIPWDGWLGPILDWLGVSVAVLVFGYCLLVVFQQQWEGSEKLTFPLAQLSLDVTRGFDGRRRLPDLFYKRLFWIGFGIVFAPQLYNIVTYFTPGLVSFDLFWTYSIHQVADGWPAVFIRVMPLMLMVIYLCPVDILGSLVLFHWIAESKLMLIDHFGAPDLGFSKYWYTERHRIVNTESYGAMIFVGLWSIWIARRHLRQVWHQVRSGAGDAAEVLRYRLAVAGMLFSAIYVIGWAMYLGVSLPMAAGSFVLMTLVFFVTVKLLAASGVAYIYPRPEYLKGTSFILDLIGSVYVHPERMVPYRLFTSTAFFGNLCIPAWPAIPHHLRIFSLKRQPGWVSTAVIVAFLAGFPIAVWATLDLAYEEGHGGNANRLYNAIVHLLEHDTSPHWGKWAVWLGGFTEAGVITLLRARFHWFSIHPIGLIFQHIYATWLYWINLLVIWILKLALLHYGGTKAYQAGKPFFYGMGLAYVLGVILSTGVDMIWFPTVGHRVHGW